MKEKNYNDIRKDLFVIGDVVEINGQRARVASSGNKYMCKYEFYDENQNSFYQVDSEYVYNNLNKIECIKTRFELPFNEIKECFIKNDNIAVAVEINSAENFVNDLLKDNSIIDRLNLEYWDNLFTDKEKTEELFNKYRIRKDKKETKYCLFYVNDGILYIAKIDSLKAVRNRPIVVSIKHMPYLIIDLTHELNTLDYNYGE